MPRIGIMISLTSASTILPNAAPMMTPIARLSALPLSANSLSSSHMGYRPRKGGPRFRWPIPGSRKARRAVPRDKVFQPGEATELCGSRPRAAAALAVFRRGRTKNHRVEPSLAHGQAQIPQTEKRDQCDKQNGGDAEEPRETAAADRRHAVNERLSTQHSLDRFFDHMGDEKKDSQEQSFVEDRIDKGPGAQPASWVEHLEQHHHFGEDEGVDEGEAQHGEIDPVLAHAGALIEHEDAEQNPKIEEKHKKPAELVGGLAIQRARAVSVGAGRDDVVCTCWIRCHRIASQTIMELAPKIHLYGCLAPFFDFVAFLPFSLAALEVVAGPSSSSLARKSATRASVTRRAQ